MKEVCINVKDTINSPSALTREQGGIIYNIIREKILGGYKVELDFQDVESLITPFLNVAIGKLYEDFSSEDLQEKLKVINIPQGKSSSFKIVIENAKKYYADKKMFNEIVEDVVDTWVGKTTKMI